MENKHLNTSGQNDVSTESAPDGDNARLTPAVILGLPIITNNQYTYST